MHHSLKLTTIAAVVFALTACVDSPTQLTSPEGPGFAKGDLPPITINGAQQALYDELKLKLDALYSCVTDPKQVTNKNNDAEKAYKFANLQQWDEDPYGNNSVEYMVKKLAANAYALISANKIPAICDAYTDRTALADEIASLLQAFWASGSESENTEIQATSCSFDEDCEELNGNGWGVTIPAGTFNQDVVIIVLNNPAPFPDPNHNAVGNSKHFQVYPATANANSPWTRWLCWEGLAPGEEVDPANPDYVIMVRADDLTGELEFLPTEEGTGDWCQAATVDPLSSMSPLLRGARKLFAGSIFLPNTLHAYVPTKPFGGAGTIASPHWLLYIVPIPGCDLTCLRAKTDLFYGDNTQNKNAALTKLDNVAACATDDCWNQALLAYASVVHAQTQPPANKVLTAAQGEELIGNALALMK